MVLKKIIILLTLTSSFAYDSTYHPLQNKHDGILKKQKKKSHFKKRTTEQLHEEWEDEYKELERTTSQDDSSPSLTLSPTDLSEKKSLESFYTHIGTQSPT